MSHSEDLEELSALLILVPTGVYSGRVMHGVDSILSNRVKTVGRQAIPRTKIKVVLIPGEDWIGKYPDYKEKFVDNIKTYVLKTWKDREKYSIECVHTAVCFEATEFLTGWLLKELLAFFRSSSNSKVYIDLTAGPKEWQNAAINVVNLFQDVELYSVKPSIEKGPHDYTDPEIKDPGSPVLETVAPGVDALAKWVTPKSKNRLNAHFFLFRTIFELASEQTQNRDSPEELTNALVPIEEEAGIAGYMGLLPQSELKSKFKKMDRPAQRKSMSKILDGAKPLRLFEIKGKSVTMTLRAAILGLEIFKQQKVDNQK